VFPDCGGTISGPVQFVPGVPVVHCADENTESKVMMTINKYFFISSPGVYGMNAIASLL
jgi:hypothetical protein